MTAGFDLFGLLVEDLFGNFLMAGMAVMVMIIIFGAMFRMSILLVSAICVLFMMMFLMGVFGGVIGVIIFFGCSIYFVSAMLPWVVSQLTR